MYVCIQTGPEQSLKIHIDKKKSQTMGKTAWSTDECLSNLNFY